MESGADAVILPSTALAAGNGPQPLTVSLWFTVEHSDNDGDCLLDNGATGNGALTAVYEQDSLTLQLGATTHRIGVRDHSWNHLLFTLSPHTGHDVYLNAERILSEATLTELPSAALHVGARATGTDAWNGALDDIAVWGRTLTFGEASSLHMTDAATFKHTPKADDYGKSDITLITRDAFPSDSGRFDVNGVAFVKNVISISHNPTPDRGCIDPAVQLQQRPPRGHARRSTSSGRPTPPSGAV